MYNKIIVLRRCPYRKKECVEVRKCEEREREKERDRDRVRKRG